VAPPTIEARIVVTQRASVLGREPCGSRRTALGVPTSANNESTARNHRSRPVIRRWRRSDSAGTASRSVEGVDLLGEPDDELGVDPEQVVQ